MIHIKKKNEIHIQIITPNGGIQKELYELFSFKIKDAFWHPLVQQRVWDGVKHLYDLKTHMLPAGLLPRLLDYCDKRNYEYELDGDFTQNSFSDLDAIEFVNSLKLPLQPDRYQMKYFTRAIREKRLLILSPTASGKSLILYLITRYLDRKTLITVPNSNLIEQMYKDFQFYGLDAEKHIHKLVPGEPKFTDKKITICCWQSIYNFKNPSFWDQFSVGLFDEAHQYAAKSLQSLVESLLHCRYRFGTSGTLNGSHTDRMVLEGLFGNIYQVTTTKQLIEEKRLAQLEIKNIILKYPDTDCQEMCKSPYKEQYQWVVSHPLRMRYIARLVASPQLIGNTLILFQQIKKQGNLLFEEVKQTTTRKVFFVTGKTENDVREEVRQITDVENEAIIVASGVFSMGVNMPNLHNLVLASPTKAQIRLLQSIGRMLRKSPTKHSCVIYDIADDLCWKRAVNTLFRHFKARIKIYNSEEFPYKTYRVQLHSNK